MGFYGCSTFDVVRTTVLIGFQDLEITTAYRGMNIGEWKVDLQNPGKCQVMYFESLKIFPDLK